MNRKIAIASAAVIVALALALLSVSLFPSLFEQPAALYTLYFSCNYNTVCNPGESYSDCPDDCCEADCAADGDAVCHATCDGYAGCSSFVSGCDGLAVSTRICLNATTWAQCCSSTPVSCSAGEYCNAGYCGGCSTVCDGACESSACYPTDPDCDASGNPTGECCGNSVCDGAEDCITCPGDGCPGSVVCSVASDCDDSNSLTIDTCNNPGECDSSCSNVACSVECSVAGDCDDSNSLTIDTCNNPGECDSSCSNVVCPMACSVAGDCDDSNSLTVDTCNNPASCSAACSNTACDINCTANSECDDSNSLTTDTCTNPSTCGAACVFTPVGCTIACSSNSDCDDSNSLTVDTCNNPGACDANCSNVLCTIECSANADCDDSNSFTADTCNSPGTCSASCSTSACTPACFSDEDCRDNIITTFDKCNNPGACDANCSNAVCTPECYADSACDDSNPVTEDICFNAGGCGAHCENIVCTPVCSADADCDDSNPITLDRCQSPGACNAACTHSEQQSLFFELADGVESVLARGREIDLNVVIKDANGEAVEGASASLTDAEGNEIVLESLGNGVYAGSYSVPVDFPLGERPFSLFAEKGDLAGSEEMLFDVNKGVVRAVLIEPSELRVVAGEKVEFRLAFVYDNNEAVDSPDVNASINGVPVPLAGADGIFTGYYLFSDEDIGTASFLVEASDSFANGSTTAFPFEVQSSFPVPSFFLWLLALVVALLLAFYSFRRMWRLFSLEKKRGKLAALKKGAELKKAIADKGEKKKLEKEISKQEKEIAETAKLISLERKRHVIVWKKLPMELGYAARKLALAVRKLPARLGAVSRPGPGKAVSGRFQEIDSEVAKLRSMIQNLETEFCKQTIKEDFFREKLFEYREKIHLLELEKRKIA